ncbi:MAG TPA: hypothetical protein VEK07_14265 [Polyangiaceae bacterium]|nr:hypothetical protein [Polyangiaceae bacterium]
MRSSLFLIITPFILSLACSSPEPGFPLRQVLWQDTDTQSVFAACRREPTAKDPAHVTCAPRPYWSSLFWDGADNVIFRPISGALGLYLPGEEAANVNSVDEVPDSAWFQNRIGAHPMSIEELQRGACDDPSLLLDPDHAADGSWLVDKGKTEGTTLGFRVSVGGKKYLFKVDDPDQPELPTAAGTIGVAIYHAAGFNTPCEQTVAFKPSLLKLLPGLEYKPGNMAELQPFDRAALDGILKKTTRHADRVRMQASAWIGGYLIGPFRYEGTRSDDPNDVIPHQDRRELRGSRLLAAWMDHIDAREGNSLDAWIADRKDAADSSPGHVVHYIIDTSESLGPRWAQFEQVTRRAGYGYVFDWADFATDLGGLGAPVHTWDYVQKTPGHELFVYFNVRDFVPEGWRMEYSNLAFSRMTERDGAWMARILARFTPSMVQGLAEMGRFTERANTDYVAETLEGRLDKILDRYLTRLSPMADMRIEEGGVLCGLDLAEWRRVRPATAFRYTASSPRLGPLEVERHGGGLVCVSMPHVAPAGGVADGAQERHVAVELRDGVARGPLIVHLYDLGPSRGYRLAAVERRPE